MQVTSKLHYVIWVPWLKEGKFKEYILFVLLINKFTSNLFIQFLFLFFPLFFLLQKFRNLKVLNFDDCEFLTEIRDISDLPNLEKLSFDRCGNLMTVHHSIGFLNKLKILRARFCSKLTTFPPLNLTSLERLKLSYSSSLENFPEILGEMKNLLYLELVNLGLKELPVSFQNLVGLERLSMRDCGIVWLPRMIIKSNFDQNH